MVTMYLQRFISPLAFAPGRDFGESVIKGERSMAETEAKEGTDWENLPHIRISEGQTLPFLIPETGIPQRTFVKTGSDGKDYAEFQLNLRTQSNEPVILVCSKVLAEEVQKAGILFPRPCKIWILREGSGIRNTRYSVVTKAPT